MNVPDAANAAMMMKTHIATDGPDSQSHQLSPHNPGPLRDFGSSFTPNAPAMTWMTPRSQPSSWDR